MRLRSCTLMPIKSKLSNSDDRPEVTVIFPVYNAENYIKDTFTCILKQNYSNLKIIAIDDGSSDKSLDILNELSQDDNRVTVLKKDNGGQSSARNYGLKHMTSDFVTFVDSDDYIDRDYITKLIEPFLLNEKVMLSLVKYVRTSFFSIDNFTNNNEINFLKRDDGFNKCLLQSKGYDVSAWAKMYRAELFRNNYFLTGITYEDFEIIPRIFAKIPKNGIVASIDAVKYQYMKTPNSIITGEFKKRDLDIISIVHSGVPFIEKTLFDSREAYLAKAIASTFGVYRKAIRGNASKKNKDEIFKTLKWLMGLVNKRKKLTKKEIVVKVVLVLGEKYSVPLVKILSKILKEG